MNPHERRLSRATKPGAALTLSMNRPVGVWELACPDSLKAELQLCDAQRPSWPTYLLKQGGILLVAALGIFLGGCAAPIGADRVSTRQAYARVGGHPPRGGAG